MMNVELVLKEIFIGCMTVLLLYLTMHFLSEIAEAPSVQSVQTEVPVLQTYCVRSHDSDIGVSCEVKRVIKE